MSDPGIAVTCGRCELAGISMHGIEKVAELRARYAVIGWEYDPITDQDLCPFCAVDVAKGRQQVTARQVLGEMGGVT